MEAGQLVVPEASVHLLTFGIHYIGPLMWAIDPVSPAQGFILQSIKLFLQLSASKLFMLGWKFKVIPGSETVTLLIFQENTSITKSGI